jgi:rhamnose transport system permease protein
MNTATAPAPSTVETKRSSVGQRLVVVRELGILLALVLLIGITTIVNPRFLSAQGIRDLLLGATILAIMAVGQAVVIITRSVDLSVGSVLGLATYATGSLFLHARGLPIVAVFVVGIGLGAACGAINGGLIATARVPALVVTLGTLYIFRGIDYTWASGGQINAADMPPAFLKLGTETVLGVPILALVAVVVVVLAGFFLRSYRSGRELYAVGSNPEAARLSGIPVGRRVFWAFVTSGALAGLAGVLYAARFGTLDANAGLGAELNVVAAAVVGGVAIFGGSGSVYGAALGAVLLTVIGAALPVLGVNQFWERAAVGLLILAAIGLDRALAARVAGRLRVRRARDSEGASQGAPATEERTERGTGQVGRARG